MLIFVATSRWLWIRRSGRGWLNLMTPSTPDESLDNALHRKLRLFNVGSLPHLSDLKKIYISISRHFSIKIWPLAYTFSEKQIRELKDISWVLWDKVYFSIQDFQCSFQVNVACWLVHLWALSLFWILCPCRVVKMLHKMLIISDWILQLRLWLDLTEHHFPFYPI